LDQSFTPFVTYDKSENAYFVGFSKFEKEGIWPGYGPRVSVSSKTGEVLRYVAYFPFITISVTPRRTKNEAMEMIKSFFDISLDAVRIYPYVHTDAIGEQILFYDSVVEYTQETTDLDGKPNTRKGQMDVNVPANSLKHGDYPGYDVDALPAEHKRKFANMIGEVPEVIGVSFNGHDVKLYTPPVFRKRAVLISKDLFEALGGKVTWNQNTGEIVVQKGNDPAVLYVDSKKALLNDRKVEVEAAPEVHKDYRRDPLEDRLFIPSSLIASVLGMKVKWNEKAWTLFIETPKPERTKGEAVP
jgi:hypothetical protein